MLVAGLLGVAAAGAVSCGSEKQGKLPTGQAVATTAGDLHAKHVIHTVGPVYRNPQQAKRLLESAYRRSLEVALAKGIHSVAFPSISTGAYGYPLEEAAPVGLGTAIDFLKEHSGIELVRFVLRGSKAFNAFEEALGRLAPN